MFTVDKKTHAPLVNAIQHGLCKWYTVLQPRHNLVLNSPHEDGEGRQDISRVRMFVSLQYVECTGKRLHNLEMNYQLAYGIISNPIQYRLCMFV